MAKFSLVLNSNINSSLLMTIKKYTGVSFSEIKTNIADKKPIMVVNRRNKEELEKMKDLIQILSKHKVIFRILKQTDSGTEELTLELFMNSFERSRQIAEDRERLDAILVEEDSD
ncbi:putative uncharacterized protein [Brevibacillus laterosporus GI-9]|nr:MULTISPECIES: hypothetical protein [Brevibacillus]MCR8961999.1 hypothetical protein [Brevibacillus laterosporus]MCZ0834154.1 hypothetical protein [Brevibacillus halotolerans]CCF12222.1 putative uncharacterized protein [Brevibacillus laterosporus GI-9]